MRSLEILVTQWTKENVAPLPPVSASVVSETFARLNAVATSDILYLYSLMGGMENMTGDLWRHWSMDEILAENIEPSEFGVLFADYLISSWCYRAKAKLDNTSAVYVDHFDEKAPILVADSLEEFFDHYLKSSGEALHNHYRPNNDA
ncbi:hypothetical protein [Undibacterium sp. Ji22W]|uniref:hypothetical protein n=1 Tax=Undibacterium sp. Ji22W TaxID=3413038 RepID=UPI003BF03074